MSTATLREFSDKVISLQELPPGFKIVLVPKKKGAPWVRADFNVNVPVPTRKSLPLVGGSEKVGDLIAAVQALLDVGLELSCRVKLARLKVICPAHTTLKKLRAEEPAKTAKKTGNIDTLMMSKEFGRFLVAEERAFKPNDLAAQAVLETCMEVLIARYTRKTVAAALSRV